jgi:hypothetical protein
LKATGGKQIRALAHGKSAISLWKTELQHFADKSGLTIEVTHLLPGTSKWNEIEHRLFSFISLNWRRSKFWRDSCVWATPAAACRVGVA